MASPKIVDVIESLEKLAQSVPQELQENGALRQCLYDAVQKLVAEVETPAETLQRLLYLPCEMTSAKIGVDLNIFTQLVTSNGPVSTEDLAESSGAESALLLRLLQHMSSIGMIKEVDVGLWSPSNMTRNLASRHSAAGINHVHDSVVPAYCALPEWLKRRGYRTPITKTDTPFAQGHGAPPETSFFSWLQDHPFNATEFNIFMGVHRTGTKTWLDDDRIIRSLHQAHEKGQNGVMFVDLGGGLGQQCKALRSKCPGSDGRIILQDLPQVIQRVDLNDYKDIEKMSIDFFEGQPVKAASVYYLRSVLRDWPDAQCRKILEHIRDAMVAHSFVFIDEIVVPDKGAHKLSTQLDLTMLAMLNGGVRTESHWRDLLDASGFRVKDVVVYQGAGSEAVIIATKA